MTLAGNTCAHGIELTALCIFCRAAELYQLEQSGDEPAELKDLARDIRETNHQNGFNLPTWDNLPIKVMMAVTELNEGMDAIRGDGEDPLLEELADTAVRILDILYSIWGDDWADRTTDLMDVRPERNLFEAGEVALWRPLRMLCMAVEAWRHEHRVDVRIGLEIALKEVFSLGLTLGVDLRRVIEWKNAKNAGRGMRHGKARAEG